MSLTNQKTVAKAGARQKLTSQSKNDITFNAKITRMGDKIIIVIPKAYHKDIEKRTFLIDDFVNVKISKSD